MCGIVGVFSYGGSFEDKNLERARQEAMIYFSTELLQLTQPRGQDATGIAVMFENCDYMGLKMGISAAEFVARYGDTEKDYEGFINVWRRKTSNAVAVIGHCRKPTTSGNAGPEDNNNNHPIKVGDTLTVHNGTVSNADVVFEKLDCDRDGKVDSEAIARLMHHYTDNGANPFTTEMIEEIANRLHGSYATLTMCANNPFQIAGMRDTKPMEICVIRPLKLVIVASEEKFIKEALIKYNREAVILNPAKGLPRLSKSDVHIGMVAERTTVLFDLRKDISDKTIVGDIIEKGDIKFSGKYWSKTAAATNQNKNFKSNNNTGAGAPGSGAGTNQTGNHVAAGQKKQSTTVGARPSKGSSTGSGSAGSTDNSGMAWNDSTGKFESVSGMDATSGLGTTEVDGESGQVTDVSAGKEVKSEKKDTRASGKSFGNSERKDGQSEENRLTRSNVSIETHFGDSAKVIEHTVVENKSGKSVADSSDGEIIAIHKNGVTETKPVPKNTEVVEVDMKIDPKVMEASGEAARRIESLSSDEELLQMVSIAKDETMRNMALYSLANRIRKIVYSKAWYEGYMACRKTEASSEGNEGIVKRYRLAWDKQKEKADKATAAVRTLKNLIKIIAPGVGASLKSGALTRKIAKAKESGVELNSELLAQIFSAGDLKSVETLRALKAELEKLEEENLNGKGRSDSGSIQADG